MNVLVQDSVIYQGAQFLDGGENKSAQRKP